MVYGAKLQCVEKKNKKVVNGLISCSGNSYCYENVAVLCTILLLGCSIIVFFLFCTTLHSEKNTYSEQETCTEHFFLKKLTISSKNPSKLTGCNVFLHPASCVHSFCAHDAVCTVELASLCYQFLRSLQREANSKAACCSCCSGSTFSVFIQHIALCQK